MTASSDERVSVRAPIRPAPVSPGGSERGWLAHARAIPAEQPERKGSDAQSRTLLRVVALRDEVSSGWALTEAPPAAGETWRQVLPPRGQAGNPISWVAMTAAGLFRAAAITGLWVLALSVSTRTRAGVGLVITILVVGTATAAHLITRS